MGGISAVTLSDEEARRRGTRKTVLERKAPPTFDVLIEIQDRDRLAIHQNVGEVVDALLRGYTPQPEVRQRTASGGDRHRAGRRSGSDRRTLDVQPRARQREDEMLLRRQRRGRRRDRQAADDLPLRRLAQQDRTRDPQPARQRRRSPASGTTPTSW